MLIGYARVSTLDQNPQMQIDALNKAGCEKIFSDTASGSIDERPGLVKALSFVRPGDTLVAWKLDRLGRSLKHLIEVVTGLQTRGVGFTSLNENIDTLSPTGKLIFHVFAALSEFEREIIRQRTLAGLESARARGRRGGRPFILDEKKHALAKSMLADKSNSVRDVCRLLGVSKATLYRYAGRPV